MSRALRIIDGRIRLALLGTEPHRAVVDSVHGRTAIVSFAGGLLPAIVPALPVTLVRGMVVELERPRGTGGQLQIVRVLGASGPAEVTAKVDAARGSTTIVTELPVASEAWRGVTLLLEGDGVQDAFHRCRRKADGSFEWAAV